MKCEIHPLGSFGNYQKLSGCHWCNLKKKCEEETKQIKRRQTMKDHKIDINKDNLPSSMQTSEADVKEAVGILDSEEQRLVIRKQTSDGPKPMLIRYLRRAGNVPILIIKQPLVKPNGKVIPLSKNDVKAVLNKIPYACMVAFTSGSKPDLLIGWSKRFEGKQLPDSSLLRLLYSDIAKLVDEPSLGLKTVLAEFSDRLSRFMSIEGMKDVEICFSKRAGKVSAILRALHDTISINDHNYVESSVSGVIPKDVTKALAWFIPHAESIYGSKAKNVVH